MTPGFSGSSLRRSEWRLRGTRVPTSRSLRTRRVPRISVLLRLLPPREGSSDSCVSVKFDTWSYSSLATTRGFARFDTCALDGRRRLVRPPNHWRDQYSQVHDSGVGQLVGSRPPEVGPLVGSRSGGTAPEVYEWGA